MSRKLSWRNLDNIAKIFSLDDKNNINIFRYTITLKNDVDKYKLRQAVKETLKIYSVFKVKMKAGFFWNYLAFNNKEPLVKELKSPEHYINFKENNDYLFRVSYYKNIINLDVFHVLTDGLGAKELLKSIVSIYLDLTNNLNVISKSSNDNLNYQDQYLINYDKKIKTKQPLTIAYQFEDKFTKKVSMYNFRIKIKDIKTMCQKMGVSITEYITALYIYAISLSIKKKNQKEIFITVPIDLRKIYLLETLSNFFVCMNINSKLYQNNLQNFDEILNQVHLEFTEKLDINKIKEYLASDVKLGTNILINLIPLFLKKLIMKIFGHLFSKASTTTVSNVGIFDFEDKYKEQIENILVTSRPIKYQKVKCTIYSFKDNLNISISSNIENKDIENNFMKLLQKNFETVKVSKTLNDLY